MFFIIFLSIFTDNSLIFGGSNRRDSVAFKVSYFNNQFEGNKNKNSTPYASGSNLQSNMNNQMISYSGITDNNQQDRNCVIRSNFIFSTIFKDQKKLKELFGVYKLYGEYDVRIWFASIKGYVNLNYQNPRELLDYFHIFLSKDLQKWFLKLDKCKKINLDTFEECLLNEVFTMECQYENLVILKQKAFLEKVKELFKDDPLVNELEDNPLSSYLKLKLIIIRKIYPKVCKEDAVRMAVLAIDNDQVKKQFSKFLKSDLDDIFSLAQSLDDPYKKNSIF